MACCRDILQDRRHGRVRGRHHAVRARGGPRGQRRPGRRALPPGAPAAPPPRALACGPVGAGGVHGGRGHGRARRGLPRGPPGRHPAHRLPPRGPFAQRGHGLQGGDHPAHPRHLWSDGLLRQGSGVPDRGARAGPLPRGPLGLLGALDARGDHLQQRVLPPAAGGEVDPEEDAQGGEVDGPRPVRGPQRRADDAALRHGPRVGPRVPAGGGGVRGGRGAVLPRVRRRLPEAPGIGVQV
mmetsp:Transcript_122633/g.281119  ORF Transcript_122633/g.281119 Transcript_122633/m.281119 type:complete len:239 (-) Transcript_122633:415-1131(-)